MDSVEIEPGVRVTNERCLILEKERTLVIGDLHLGYEKALEDDGIYIPRMNTDSIRDSLNRIISKYEPERIVLLGDIKHDFKRAKYEGKEEVRSVLRLIMEAAEVVVVKGNHDNYIQNIISEFGLEAADYVDIGGYRLEHGHEDSGVRPVVIGHEHPSVRIPGEMSGGMKVQCFLYARKEGIIVIPPFSFLSTGTDMSGAYKENFMSEACRNADIAEAELFGISDMGILQLGKLGDISDLRI
ncbi:MAG: metallophosphoesterase [Candidatus Methanomethylophilaceae archaeon]|nr:metallophosphoesterase [Candidatus Methanomethylophilaceae archaeon]